MKGAMLERDIQARVVAYARKCGVIARKLCACARMTNSCHKR